MIERTKDRLRVKAPMIMSSADGLLAAGRAAFRGPREIIDLAEVKEVDSSALAVMIAWTRDARKEGRSLLFVNLPTGVRALAALYGVDDILSVA